MNRLFSLIVAFTLISGYALGQGTVIGGAQRCHGLGDPNLSSSAALQRPDFRYTCTEYVDTLTKKVYRYMGSTNVPRWVEDPIGGGGSDNGSLIAGSGISITGSSPALTISATDNSLTNEGVLGVGVGGANTAIISSNTSGASGVTLAGSNSISITESTSANGGTITATLAQQGATTGQVLGWNSTAWVPQTVFAGATAIDTLANYSALRSYTGGNAVLIQDHTYSSGGDNFTVKGGLFFIRNTTASDDSATVIVAAGGRRYVREGINQNEVFVDWFHGFSASKRIERAVAKLQHGGRLVFSRGTYTQTDPLYIDSLQNITITSIGATVLQRPNWSAISTTLSASYSSGFTLQVASVPSTWEVGDALIVATGSSNTQISQQTRIAAISGTTITLDFPVNSQFGGLFTAPIGAMVFENFPQIYGRPSADDGVVGAKGVNNGTKISNIIFDGNRASNNQVLGWTVMSSISLHGANCKIENNQFLNHPSEVIIGFGLSIENNLFRKTGGSPFHLSGHDVTLQETLSNTFIGNICDSVNITDYAISGHNEGSVSLSWNGGNVAIVNNYFRGVGNSHVIGTITGAQGSANDREDIVLSGNRCYGYEGIIAGLDASSQPFIVSDNIFDNCGTNTYTQPVLASWCGNVLSGGTTASYPASWVCGNPSRWSDAPSGIYRLGQVGVNVLPGGTNTTNADLEVYSNSSLSTSNAFTITNPATTRGITVTDTMRVGIGNTAAARNPSNKLTVDNGLEVDFGDGSMNVASTTTAIGIGRLTAPPSGKAGNYIYHLSGYNGTLDKSLGELVLQSASNATATSFGTGITLVTGETPAPRFNINNAGATRIYNLAGTGNRLVHATANGTLGISTFDPSTAAISAGGATNKVAYWSNSNTLTQNSNFGYDGANLTLGHNTAAEARLDVNGIIQARWGTGFTSLGANNAFTVGPIGATLPTGSSAGYLGTLTAFNSTINRPLRTVVLSGSSDGLGDGISMVTGTGGVERLNIGVTGNVLVNSLAGTGTRMVVASNTGVLSTQTIPGAGITAVGTGLDVNSGTLDIDLTEFGTGVTAPNASGSSTTFLNYNTSTTLTQRMNLDDISKFVNHRDTFIMPIVIYDGTTALPSTTGVKDEGWYTVPDELNGFGLVAVNYDFFSVPSSGTDYVITLNQAALGGGAVDLPTLTVAAGSSRHRRVAGATTLLAGDMIRLKIITAGTAIPLGLKLNLVLARPY